MNPAISVCIEYPLNVVSFTPNPSMFISTAITSSLSFIFDGFGAPHPLLASVGFGLRVLTGFGAFVRGGFVGREVRLLTGFGVFGFGVGRGVRGFGVALGRGVLTGFGALVRGALVGFAPRVGFGAFVVGFGCPHPVPEPF